MTDFISNTGYFANDDPEESHARDRRALEPVKGSLTAAGFYAYQQLTEDNRWSIAADDEAGRVDVLIGDDGFEVVLRASSPGLYADDESDWRRQSRARLARISLVNIARGQLEPHQTASWDEVEQGVAVTERYELPFNRADDIGTFVREHLPHLEGVLMDIERKLN